jgi:hypothetical protein
MTADIINLADYRGARTAPAARSPEVEVVPVDEAISICLARREILTDWEEQFLVSIRRSYPSPSSKQCVVLQNIFDKVCGVPEEDDAS